jgi:transposase InsO family protein
MWDNAVVETFFKTIKSELIWPVAWQTRSTLGYKSPVQFEMAGRE